MKVWLDGGVVEGPDAKVPVTDHGLLYGDGVFEGMRVFGGGVFRLEAHLARLAASAAHLSLKLPGEERLREAVLATVRAFAAPEAYVRLIVTRGDGPLGVDPTLCASPRMICIVDDLELYPREKLSGGLALVTASLRRPGPDVLDPRVKSLNYLNSVLAKLEARRRGADEALLLNAAGNIAEAAVANIFCLRRGRLLTPPLSEGALEGITRDSVLALGAALGLPVVEAPLGRVDLFSADEVFLTGSGAGIVAVRSLDGQAIAGASGCGVPGPVTLELTRRFRELAKSQCTPAGVSTSPAAAR